MIGHSSDVPVMKSSEQVVPVPFIWRSTLAQIVDALVEKDYQLSRGLSGVVPPDKPVWSQIEKYIMDCGARLIRLPDETWSSSVCIRMDGHWEVLLDLWAEDEGRSDLVLHAKVFEAGDGHLFEIYMVYVP